MKSRIIIVSLLLIAVVSVFSQGTNSWINFSQTYFRVPVAQDGLYRITQSQLSAAISGAGSVLENIQPQQFQMFRRGAEIAILVEVNASNDVTAIEFYGQKNDGQGDAPLYRNSAAQPHQLHNLFTDTAAYFLTWSLTGTGKRMEQVSTLSPNTRETYHLEEELLLNTTSYAFGDRYGASNELSSGLYDLGEGWSGPTKSKNQNDPYEFNLLRTNRSAGVAPKLEMQLLGRNNQAHRSVILVGPSLSELRALDTVSGFSSQNYFDYQGDLQWSDVSAVGALVVQMRVIGFPSAADAQSVSYIRVTYPQDLDLPSGDNKLYRLRTDDLSDIYVRIPTANTDVRMFDVTDPVHPFIRFTQPGTDEVFFSVASANVSRKIYACNSTLSVDGLYPAMTNRIDPSGADYFIITHRALMDVNGRDPIQEYADYRSQDFTVTVAEIHAVYNQFNYGDPSPIAIKNYLSYVNATTDPQYVLLIGKGQTQEKDPFRTPTATPQYVPTYGFPASDVLFSVGVAGTTGVIPSIPVGRINAYTGEQVLNYLDKVKGMENLPYDALWRKRLVHLSGGRNPAELERFSGYVQDFKVAAESDYLGGLAFNRGKSNAGIDFVDVVDIINEGVGMITFFGHSSSSATDIEIGKVTEPQHGYANTLKYPVILMNGCQGGAIFGNTVSFGEDWVSAKDLGAIGVIANADLATSSSLKRFSDLFYEIGYGREEAFGLGLGDILLETMGEFLGGFTSDLYLSQIYGTLLQGDPAIKLFGAAYADYQIDQSGVTASPYEGDRITSNDEQFILKLLVNNFGRTVDDSLAVSVTRTFADGTKVAYSQVFQRVLYQDTLQFIIRNEEGNKNDGTSFFEVSLDPDNDIQELNETNNLASLELFIAKGNTVHLYPRNYGVVNQRDVRLAWQSADLLSEERNYSLQVDTSASFSSPFLITTEIRGQVFMEERLNFTALADSTTLFWRTRFADVQAGEDTSWVNTSFTIINAAQEGWGQFALAQFNENQIDGVSYNEATHKWDFLQTKLPVEIRTHGKRNTDGNAYEDIRVVINGDNFMITDNPNDPFCRVNTFNVVAFDKETAAPFRPFGFSGIDVFNPQVCGQLPQMIHNFSQSDLLGANRFLDSLINVLEEGDAVLLFSFDSVTYSAWDDRLKHSLAQVGIQTSTINALEDGQPVVFLGKKGMSQGAATELVDNGSGLSRQLQSLVFNGEVTGVFSSGRLVSPVIGPAKQWEELKFNDETAIGDEVQIEVVGITSNGDRQRVQNPAFRTSNLDLSTVDAQVYPFIELSYLFQDQQNLTPPQLRNWEVAYQLPPDGLLSVVDKFPVTLPEGADFSKTYQFVNISDYDFTDSLTVEYSLDNGRASEVRTLVISAPQAGDTSEFVLAFGTRNQVGDNDLITTVIPREIEQSSSNNRISLFDAVVIEGDEVNPVLDVTFDGVYIMDGDIVSPNPRIVMKLLDDNPYLFKEDTTGVEVSLKRPCEGCDYERVSLSGGNMLYVQATENQDFEIDYQPGPLDDGIYALKVQASDESGNASGATPYEISFEVINETSVTHFYPYPNPFSTNTRFVFTLTGSVIPDALKVQIMTVSGRVVREITQDEIGDLKIGNNITDFAWDGRDEYGDQLANGVYLYKVFVEQNGETFKHRFTSGDRSFKHGIGKIYLIR